MRNNALPIIIGLQYIWDLPPGSKSGDQECWISKMPDIKNAAKILGPYIIFVLTNETPSLHGIYEWYMR